MEKPLVSVICLVYNMKDYLRQTLDSILMQKTNFPFEIVVHDDVSTDGSADIVREYAEKYPDIIVPILQTENQYSKGVLITKDIILPKLCGKYAAYCEGDDYWTDPDKLQKQFDFMESHPDYTLCTAKIRQVNCSDPSVPDQMIAPSDHTGEITLEQILKMKDKQAFCTCSMFFKTDVMLTCPDNFPNRGERVKIIWLALNGKVWFINEEMGVYRRERPGSWTATSWREGKRKKINTLYGFLRVYNRIDVFTENKYSELFQDIYLQYMKKLLHAGASYGEVSNGEVKEIYDILTPDRKKTLKKYRLLLPARKFASAIKKKLK